MIRSAVSLGLTTFRLTATRFGKYFASYMRIKLFCCQRAGLGRATTLFEVFETRLSLPRDHVFVIFDLLWSLKSLWLVALVCWENKLSWSDLFSFELSKTIFCFLWFVWVENSLIESRGTLFNFRDFSIDADRLGLKLIEFVLILKLFVAKRQRKSIKALDDCLRWVITKIDFRCCAVCSVFFYLLLEFDRAQWVEQGLVWTL